MSWLFFWRRRGTPPQSGLAPSAPFMALKDEREVRRLNEQHFAIQQELGGNYGAPLAAPTAILDIGCGTGRWAMEMAVAFPAAQVVGMDVTLPDPAESLGLGIDTLPPNVSFVHADATQSLPFADQSFDYIHLCLLYAALPGKAWGILLPECVRLLRAGGWIESVESLPVSNPTEYKDMVMITTWFADLLRHRGAEPFVALKMPGWLRELGFTQIISREISDAAQKGDQQEAILELEALIDYLRQPVIDAGITTADVFERVAAKALQEIHYSTRGSGFNTYDTYGQRHAE